MSVDSPSFGKKYTFFRSQYAINFQAVISKKAFNTVNIEIAPVVNKNAVWASKITLQLSEVDLFKFFYTISHELLFIYESKYHGKNNNKSIRFVESVDGCNITLSDHGNVMHFKCSIGEWFYAQMLMLEQLLNHSLSIDEAKSLLVVKKSVKTNAQQGPV